MRIDEDRGDQRESCDREHIERCQQHDRGDRPDRQRRLVPAEGALFRLGQIEKIALLHQPMDPFRRPLHEQRVAKGQPHILEFLAQVFPLPMEREDQNAVALAEIEFPQRLADKRRSGSR